MMNVPYEKRSLSCITSTRICIGDNSVAVVGEEGLFHPFGFLYCSLIGEDVADLLMKEGRATFTVTPENLGENGSTDLGDKGERGIETPSPLWGSVLAALFVLRRLGLRIRREPYQ